jgi:hypothetical protein
MKLGLNDTENDFQKLRIAEEKKKKKNKSMEGGYHGGNPTLGVVVLWCGRSSMDLILNGGSERVG